MNARRDSVREIGRDELRAKLNRDDCTVVMGLNEWAYYAKRIPGSTYFATSDEFPTFTFQDEIVVYGDKPGCLPSLALYHALVNAGYTNVRLYAGGLADWEAAGFPLEGEWVDDERPAESLGAPASRDAIA